MDLESAQQTIRSLCRAAGIKYAPGRYAAICLGCAHSSSLHLLAAGGDFQEGPYRCPCGCEIAPRAPYMWLGPSAYSVWRRSFPEPQEVGVSSPEITAV